MKLGKSFLIAGVLVPFGANADTYVVGLAHMEVFNGVCNGPHCADTDYMNLTVSGPNGQKFTQSSGPDNLHKGDRMDWKLVSSGINVPNDPNAKLVISWAAINKGHGGNPNQIKAAINSAGDAFAQKGDTNSDNLINAIIQGVKSVVGWATANCDTSLFQGTEVISGATLASSGPYPGTWKEGVPPDVTPYPGSAKQWWYVYGPYTPHPSGCNQGRYNQVVWISKQK